MDKIMDKVLEIVNKHGVTEIVKKTGLDPNTIYYWKRGRSRGARTDTVDLLLDALGYEVHIVPKTKKAQGD